MRELEVTLGPPARQSVHLDGVDIGSAVRSITIRGSANHLPEVELELCVITADLHGEGAIVRLAPGVKDALLQLGWTPPDDETR